MASDSTRRAAISGFDRPAATSPSTCSSRGVNRSTNGDGAVTGDPPGIWSANASSSRRVTRGAITASPRATVLIAPISSGGSASFSRKPLAPALSPAKAYSSTPVVGAYVALARATGIRLTFFANGVNQSWAEHQRDMQPLVDSGQIQIANHTWDHPDIRTLTDAELVDQLDRNDRYLTST